MPLYEYRCDECSQESELLIRSSQKPCCPKCNSGRMQRVLSTVSTGSKASSLPVVGETCPPPSAGPCRPGCCRLPS